MGRQSAFTKHLCSSHPVGSWYSLSLSGAREAGLRSPIPCPMPTQHPHPFLRSGCLADPLPIAAARFDSRPYRYHRPPDLSAPEPPFPLSPPVSRLHPLLSSPLMLSGALHANDSTARVA
jgi:hypothetical protein